MTEERAERRLMAILAADVVGYSRMVAEDEAGTLAKLRSVRAEILDPSIAEHGGRIVKTTGDGVLAEFPSAVDALRCALSIQTGMASRENSLRLRIGVNVGDVVIEGDDIYGDRVNIAARLESNAEPGGVAISGAVREYIVGRIDAAFRDGGQRELKNIDRPINVWLWSPENAAATPALASALPDMPSIAVLPFENMSGDAEQAYLADGIAEDILTGLAQVRWLVVNSRNSSFAYRGKNIDLKRVARELGARYVLEGSIRRAGERVRVTAQLIDASEDRHIWAERYDRKLEDIFDLQDEITTTILGAIEPELGLAEEARARRKPPESLDAWDRYLRGQWHQFRYTAVDNCKAQDCFRRAIEIDPEFAASHAGLAYACHHAIISDFSDDPATQIAEGVKAARRAVGLDERDARAYSVLARILCLNGEHDAALMAGRKAVELNPNNAQARFGNGQALTYAGESEEALAELDVAIRLSPRDPNLWAFMIVIAWALGNLERNEEAADWARRAAEQPNARLWPNVTLVAALGHLGRQDEARAAFSRFRAEYPERDLLAICEILPFRSPAHQAHLPEGVRKAGVLY